jgi:hypothetical protein
MTPNPESLVIQTIFKPHFLLTLRKASFDAVIKHNGEIEE